MSDDVFWIAVLAGTVPFGLVGLVVYVRSVLWEKRVKGLVRPAAKRGHGPLTGHGQK